jgi:hypothetical protein
MTRQVMFLKLFIPNLYYFQQQAVIFSMNILRICKFSVVQHLNWIHYMEEHH